MSAGGDVCLKHFVRWLLALALLGGALFGRICVPAGLAAAQQAVFGCCGSTIESAAAVLARGGSAEEAAACFAAD